LAQTSYWQGLYRNAKELNLQLFDNNKDFSVLQVKFIYWLSVYDMLYEELGKHEDDYLTENVIKHELRCDAYLIYRNKKHDYFWKKHHQEQKLAEAKNRKSKPFKHPGKQSVINVDFRKEDK